MALTKKHYDLLAEVVRGCTLIDHFTDQFGTSYPAGNLIAKVTFIKELCAVLADDNPRFDEARFINACYRPKG